MKKTATIFDYARMCEAYKHCRECPFVSDNNGTGLICREFIRTFPGKANEIILKWREEHPIKTRQDRFLKMFPKAETNTEGRIAICPNSVEYDYMRGCANVSCPQCMDKYWLAEVNENDTK